MTDPDRNQQSSEQHGVALWIVVGLMAVIVVGGLTYGLSRPADYASNPPQTVGSAASHARSGHAM